MKEDPCLAEAAEPLQGMEMVQKIGQAIAAPATEKVVEKAVKKKAPSPTKICRYCARNRSESKFCKLCQFCQYSCCHCRNCPKCEIFTISNKICRTCLQCATCCTCPHCRVCHGKYRPNDMCPTCQRCHNCCDCTYCDNCNARGAIICRHCNYCVTCCRCRKIKLVSNPLVFHETAEMRRNPSQRYISTEIEVSGIKQAEKDVFEAVTKWKGSIVEDGSLPLSGFEINTSPAAGDLFPLEIEEICDALAKAKAWVEPCCGLHVHVNAKDFDYEKIRRLMYVYMGVESTLFRMIAASRRNGDAARYCQPCEKRFRNVFWSVLSTEEKNTKKILPLYPESSEKLKQFVQRGVYGQTMSREDERWMKEDKHNCRYRRSALNLHSWFFRGTVECRLFEGTIDKNEIIPWGKLWAQMLDWTATHTDAEAMTLAEEKPLDQLACLVAKDETIFPFVEMRLKKNG